MDNKLKRFCEMRLHYDSLSYCFNNKTKLFFDFLRAMHFSTKRGLAIACRLSVRLSVTLVDCDHIGWNSWKIISPLVSLGCSLSEDEHQGSTPSETHGNFGQK